MQILSNTELKRFHEDHMKPGDIKRQNFMEEKIKIDPMINGIIPEENSS
jgi:hypothetical protein